MNEEPKRCIHCVKTFTIVEPFKEGELIIVTPDGWLHYDCFDRYLGNREYASEAILKDGKVIYI